MSPSGSDRESPASQRAAGRSAATRSTDIARAPVPRVRERREEVNSGDPRMTAAVVDLFVYVVVLHLFVEYLPGVLSETFTLSLLTAVLLTGRPRGRGRRQEPGRTEVRAGLDPSRDSGGRELLWVCLVGSKCVVLEAVALVFGARVSLGASPR